MTNAPSAVFFGLRSGVELFSDPSSAAAVTRAKEAALLYDRVIFEVGLLDVTVGEGGSWSAWIPPEQITPEQLARARQPLEVGSGFQVGFAVQEAQGVPADPADMVTAINTTISRAYVAEYHSGILDELLPLQPDWVEAIATPSNFPARTPIAEVIRRRNFADLGDKSLLEDLTTFERDLVYKSFNRDCAVSAELGAAMTVTPLFEPMVQRHGHGLDLPGDRALSILVPNLGSVPWEAVLEFREHPACGDARGQLREFERIAAEGEPEDAMEFLRKVARLVTRAYMQALDDRRTRLGVEVAKEAVTGGVSMIPGVGPVAASAGSLAQAGREAAAQRRSWTSAIFKLAKRGS